MRGVVTALATLLLLSGCGYKPLYATDSGDTGRAADLSEVAVAPIEGRLGNTVRAYLLNQVAPYGQQKSVLYRLDVALEADRIELAVQRDRTATRFDIRLRATVRLVSLKANDVVFTSATQSSASYDVVTSDFATLVAERDAENRVAEQISVEIATHIALFLERQRERRS